MTRIHPLVRDLYKRWVANVGGRCCAPHATFTSIFLIRLLPYHSAIILGKDYPHPEGIDYVRRKWKEALRDPANCKLIEGTSPDIAKENERIIRKAVGRGRHVSSCSIVSILQQIIVGIIYIQCHGNTLYRWFEKWRWQYNWKSIELCEVGTEREWMRWGKQVGLANIWMICWRNKGNLPLLRINLLTHYGEGWMSSRRWQGSNGGGN